MIASTRSNQIFFLSTQGKRGPDAKCRKRFRSRRTLAQRTEPLSPPWAGARPPTLWILTGRMVSGMAAGFTRRFPVHSSIDAADRSARRTSGAESRTASCGLVTRGLLLNRKNRIGKAGVKLHPQSGDYSTQIQTFDQNGGRGLMPS